MKYISIILLLLVTSCTQPNRLNESCEFSLTNSNNCRILTISGSTGKVSYRVHGNPESNRLEAELVDNAVTVNSKNRRPATINAQSWNAKVLAITFFGKELHGKWLILNYGHEIIMIKVISCKDDSIRKV